MLIRIKMALFESLPAQLQGQRYRSKLRRSDFGHGLDGLENQRCFNEATREVSSFKKHPHLPEAEHWLPQNAASAAMVPAGGR